MDNVDDLGDLLLAAARGNRAAFRRFYDATSARAFHLELVRARAGGAARPHAVAERATADRFLRAWRSAPDYAASGLSPLAWLLGLPVTPAPEPAQACALEAIA